MGGGGKITFLIYVMSKKVAYYCDTLPLRNDFVMVLLVQEVLFILLWRLATQQWTRHLGRKVIYIEFLS